MSDFRALSPEFYAEPTVKVAESLLGQCLVHETAEGLCAGIIVEVEAYLAEGDPGCHAAGGRTNRNAPMFAQPGTAYVYFTYGMHYLVNVVTAPEGVPEAVLIRALEPTHGLDLMRRRRGVESIVALCSGPAKLCQALAITLDHNRAMLTQPPLYIAKGPRRPQSKPEIVTTTRIGLSEAKGGDLPLRFYLADNQFASRR
jgi:DNA-3-methyladenine glycosylase